MTLPRLKAMNEYNRYCPPAHLQLRQIAAVLGIKPEVKQVASTSQGGIEDFLTDLAAVGGV